ncbi:SDR family NAD(P)-dependent oxidoreductase [Microlunatus aurantiacus]|uniref:SDR family NAD(P)-dependent oxidoreductase n=1 Tax=Microlunatus aurantiacus TaxID=446786 RepID=A0ABP7DIJ5_9ACTN
MTTALVTGGTSGIGAAFARALAGRGDDLVLVARDAGRLAEMATELTAAHGVDVEVMSADLGDRDDVQRVANRLASTEQPVDLLVNNAGFGVPYALTNADTTPHEHAIDVMIRAVLVLGGAAGRTMKARGGGTIINVSSTAGFVTMGGYSAIKAWVTVYSEGLANELRGTGVQVTALCPGWVRTEFHQRADIKTSKIPDQLWLDAERLVSDCLTDVERHKVISIPSKRYQALILAARLAPRTAIRAVSRKLSSGRH